MEIDSGSPARKFPDYVPEPIRADYEEACLIRDLSPKASATLARRALQGMIHDFWKIHEKNLYEEIKALEGQVDTTTWKAIDTVRKVGNIGAHMEKDIDLIVEVEPREAQLLIWLIETLIEDWYITRAERAARLQEVIDLGARKQDARRPASEPVSQTDSS